MSDVKALYDEDFFLWSQAQAEALRAAARSATNEPIDWENVAEEIESLHRSDRRELSSQIGRIIEHLLKLEFSHATDPRGGWSDPIVDARNEIERVLDDSPSLRNQIESLIAEELRRGSRKAARELAKYSELGPAVEAAVRAKRYAPEQILGEWFPSDPEEPARGE
jgi:hypothetical protein